jgi:thiol-disulfide isomerase/thioredoxin
MRLILGVVAALTLFAGVLSAGHAAADKPSAPPPQAAKASPFAVGALKKLDVSSAGSAAPAEPLQLPGGQTTTLAAYKGRVVVLNLWATWCAPCLKELPSLNALQKSFDPKDMIVVAASMDRGGWRAIDPYWKKARLNALVPHLDKSTMMAFNLKARGLPLTIIYDRQGREAGRVVGDADWASKEARSFVRAVTTASARRE